MMFIALRNRVHNSTQHEGVRRFILGADGHPTVLIEAI